MPLVTVNVWYHVGSAREKPGRTGFAHLFEHLMFMGSKHAKYGDFDTLLEAAGGTNNASTGEDRTNYYIDVPSNALDLALFLESDRMALSARRDVAEDRRRASATSSRTSGARATRTPPTGWRRSRSRS